MKTLYIYTLYSILSQFYALLPVLSTNLARNFPLFSPQFNTCLPFSSHFALLSSPCFLILSLCSSLHPLSFSPLLCCSLSISYFPPSMSPYSPCPSKHFSLPSTRSMSCRPSPLYSFTAPGVHSLLIHPSLPYNPSLPSLQP